VPLLGSPPRQSHAASRRKSLAQQIEGAEERAAALPSVSPRSPHLGRASRSPKTKSTAVPGSSMAGGLGDALPAAGELPRICTEDLARLLHADGPPSPTGPAPTVAVVPVAGLSEQLKEKAAPVPLSPKKGPEPTKL
jgi:hypothetical protein